MARVVKPAGKHAFLTWELGDGRTIHCNKGERGLAKMGSEDLRRQEKSGPKQSIRPAGRKR